MSVRLEDEDFAGEGGDPRDAEIYFERRDNTLKVVARPTFIDGTSIEPIGYVDDVNRRDELAKLVRTSPELPPRDRQPDVGAFLRLRVYQARRRHGAAQPAVASGVARQSGARIQFGPNST